MKSEIPDSSGHSLRPSLRLEPNKGGWAVAQGPIRRTTITLKRLKRKAILVNFRYTWSMLTSFDYFFLILVYLINTIKKITNGLEININELNR